MFSLSVSENVVLNGLGLKPRRHPSDKKSNLELIEDGEEYTRIHSMQTKLDNITLSAGMAFSEHASSNEFIEMLSRVLDDLAEAFEHSMPYIIQVTSNYHLIESMLRHGLDPNKREPRNQLTALHCAMAEGNIQLVRLLIEHGADLNARDSLARTPIHYMNSWNNYEKIVRLMVEKGANLNAQDAEGQLPLHVALMCQGALLVEYLHNRSNVQLSYRTKNGKTFLHYAERQDVVSYLLNRGVDVNAKDANLDTPLHEALRHERWEMAEMLLKYGANPNLKNADGNVALHLALMNDASSSFIRMLFRVGADVDAVNSSGDSVIKLSLKWWSSLYAIVEEVVKLEFMGKSLNRENKKAILVNCDAREYYDSCKAELEVWKEIKLSNEFSCYEILTLSSNELSRLFENKHMQDWFYDLCLKDSFKNKPIYCISLALKFKNSTDRLRQIEWVKEILNQTLPTQVLREAAVVERIICNFTSNDMLILLELANVYIDRDYLYL